MISVKGFLLPQVFCLLFWQMPLMAEVVVEKRVNSWSQEGYLIVVSMIILAFSLCLGFAYYEHKRKNR